MPTSETDPQPERRFDGQVLLAGVSLLAILGFAWAVRSSGRESDHRAVMRQVREIEASLQLHGPGFWASVEGQDSPQHSDPTQEKTHQAILADFERLAHLGEFEMKDIRIAIDSDQARVSYRIEGLPRDEPLPAGGDLRFTRRGTTWQLTGHRFIEQPSSIPIK